MYYKELPSYREPGGASLRFWPMFIKNNRESQESTSEYLRIQERDDSSVSSHFVILPQCSWLPWKQKRRYLLSADICRGLCVLHVRRSILKLKMAANMAYPLGRKLFGRFLNVKRCHVLFFFCKFKIKHIFCNCFYFYFF